MKKYFVIEMDKEHQKQRNAISPFVVEEADNATQFLKKYGNYKYCGPFWEEKEAVKKAIEMEAEEVK